MNLKQLKFAFELSDGTLRFAINDPSTEAIRKKLTSPPLQGRLDINIVKANDGTEFVYLPKSEKNQYAFTHLLVIDPKDDADVEIPKPTAEIPKQIEEKAIVIEKVEPSQKKVEPVASKPEAKNKE